MRTDESATLHIDRARQEVFRLHVDSLRSRIETAEAEVVEVFDTAQRITCRTTRMKTKSVDSVRTAKEVYDSTTEQNIVLSYTEKHVEKQPLAIPNWAFLLTLLGAAFAVWRIHRKM